MMCVVDGDRYLRRCAHCPHEDRGEAHLREARLREGRLKRAREGGDRNLNDCLADWHTGGGNRQEGRGPGSKRLVRLSGSAMA